MEYTFYFYNITNAVILIYLGQRYLYRNSTIHRRMILAPVLVYTFLVPTTTTIVLHFSGVHIPWQLYTIATLGMQASASTGYFAILQVLNNKPISNNELLNHPIIKLLTTSLIISVINDYARRLSYTWVLDVNINDQSWEFILSELCLTILILQAGWYTLTLFRHGLIIYDDPILLTRIAVMVIAFCIGLVGAGLLTLNALIALWSTEYNSSIIRWFVWNISSPIVFLTYALASLTPERFFRKLHPFVAPYWQQRYQQHQNLLDYLHQQMMSIVPDASFPIISSTKTVQMVEINDARRRLWSHIPNRRRVCPLTEAQKIMQLLKAGEVLEKAGTHPLPPLPKQAIPYNLTVARRLRHLSRSLRKNDQSF